ncbi:MAG: sulfotransferase family protein [Ekhidna sp.]
MIINLISGPRNISTALMYSFSQRVDTKVVDEPFYGYYLNKTNMNHPGADEIMNDMCLSVSKILHQVYELQKEYPNVFLKNMAHHHIDFDWDYLKNFQNVFLIRDPKQLISSFAQVIENPTINDIGLKHEADLFEYCKKNGEHKPIIIDSNDLLSNPEKYLSYLCKELGLSFSNSMTSWKQGAIPEDGIWAQYWYKNVHLTTGFSKQKTSSRPLLPKHQSLYEEAHHYFEKLSSHKSIFV